MPAVTVNKYGEGKAYYIAARTGENNFTFVMNFTEEEKTVSLGREEYIDMLSGEKVSKEICLDKYGIKVLKQ